MSVQKYTCSLLPGLVTKECKSFDEAERLICADCQETECVDGVIIYSSNLAEDPSQLRESIDELEEYVIVLESKIEYLEKDNHFLQTKLAKCQEDK